MKRTFVSTLAPEFFLVMRHGKAQYTQEEDEGGDSVEGVLTEEGKREVTCAATEILSLLHSLGKAHVRIIMSPKRRCIESAEALSEYFSRYRLSSTLEIHNKLCDVTVIGPREGLSNSYSRWEGYARQGESWFDGWKRYTAHGGQFYPGEESPQDLKKRIDIEIQEIFSSKHDQPIIIVCHEEVMDAIAEYFQLRWHPPRYGEVWYIYPPEDRR